MSNDTFFKEVLGIKVYLNDKRITYDQLIDNENYKQLKLWGRV